MKLNVIIYTHSADPRGIQLLEAILPQLLSEDFVLIWDDCSPHLDFREEMWRVVRKANTAMFSFIESPLGVSQSRHRNLALEQIKDGWVIELDQDEMVQPGFILAVKKAILHNPDTTVFNLQRANLIVENYQMAPQRFYPQRTDYINFPDLQPRVHQVGHGFSWVFNWHQEVAMPSIPVTILEPEAILLHNKTERDRLWTMRCMGAKLSYSNEEWEAVMARKWGVPENLRWSDYLIDAAAGDGLNAWLASVSGCQRMDCYEASPIRYQHLLANLDPDRLNAGFHAFNYGIGDPGIVGHSLGFSHGARPRISLNSVIQRAHYIVRWLHVAIDDYNRDMTVDSDLISTVQTLCLEYRCPVPRTHIWGAWFTFKDPVEFNGATIFVGERITPASLVSPPGEESGPQPSAFHAPVEHSGVEAQPQTTAGLGQPGSSPS